MQTESIHMKKSLSLILIIMATTVFSQNSIYDFKFNTIDGKEIEFSSFKGKKLLLVNTASECGFTPQYQELQALHESHGEDLIIIGFPANNFGGQEPGENEEIAAFCQKNYGVTFLMAEKVSVAGATIHPLFKWLVNQENDSFTGAINWNFEKFLIGTDGKVEARFRSAVKPNSEEIIKRI